MRRHDRISIEKCQSLMKRPLDLPDVGNLVGISERLMQKLVRDRVIPVEPDGSFILSKCIRAWVQWQLGLFEPPP